MDRDEGQHRRSDKQQDKDLEKVILSLAQEQGTKTSSGNNEEDSSSSDSSSSDDEVIEEKSLTSGPPINEASKNSPLGRPPGIKALQPWRSSSATKSKSKSKSRAASPNTPSRPPLNHNFVPHSEVRFSQPRGPKAVDRLAPNSLLPASAGKKNNGVVPSSDSQSHPTPSKPSRTRQPQRALPPAESAANGILSEDVQIFSTDLHRWESDYLMRVDEMEIFVSVLNALSAKSKSGILYQNLSGLAKAIGELDWGHSGSADEERMVRFCARYFYAALLNLEMLSF